MNIELYLILITLTLATLHMIAPDHWMPISIISAKRKYLSAQTDAYSFSIGFAHGLLSALLALGIAYLGVSLIGYNQVRIGSVILLAAVCIYIFANVLKEKKNSESVENTSLIVSFIPDPAFLPIVLASVIYGGIFVGTLSLLFIFAGGISLMIVTSFARKGMLKALEKVDPVNIDYVVILVLAITAIFIYFT